MEQTQWIAVDWGTSNLRLWVLGPGDALLAERSSDEGMGALRPEGFEPALLRLVGDMLPPGRSTPVLVCGMAGARQGWAEAPYLPLPAPPTGLAPLRAPAVDPRLSVWILPGLSQSDPPDVMRGEETQIAGFLSREPGFAGTLCLPGTHCKWVRLSGGRVTGFRTAMTGELFALLSRQSVLRHGIAGAEPDPGAFLHALREAAADPSCAMRDLFGIRAGALLAGIEAGAQAGRLSGLLIGAELAAMRAHWQQGEVVVIGAPALAGRYAGAIAALGGQARCCDDPALALRGLIAARAALNIF